MSDSDDTDILLLIPPNFFLTETNESPSYDMFRSNLEQPVIKSSLSPRRHDKSTNCLLSHSKDLFVTPPQLTYRPYNEPSPTMNVSHCSRSIEFERLDCIGSTDYDRSPEKCTPNRKSSSPLRRPHNLNRDINDRIDRVDSLSSKKMSDWKSNVDVPRQYEDLVSLNNVWNNNLDFRNTNSHSTELEEERLRRRQCERNISNLQSQLNQYQNKFTDVIKIDQSKNDTIAKLHSTNSR